MSKPLYKKWINGINKMALDPIQNEFRDLKI